MSEEEKAAICQALAMAYHAALMRLFADRLEELSNGGSLVGSSTPLEDLPPYATTQGLIEQAEKSIASSKALIEELS